MEEVNCRPQSEMMALGTPKCAIHPWKSAGAQSAGAVNDGKEIITALGAG